MRCYACEVTPYNRRYRLGNEGLCEYNTLDECKAALEKWRKQQRPQRSGWHFFFITLYLWCC